jgi:hypothetical protein
MKLTFFRNQKGTVQKCSNVEQHKNVWKSAGRALSLRVIPWHLPYN